MFEQLELMGAAVGEIAEVGVDKLMAMAGAPRIIKVVISGVEHVVEWVGQEVVLPIKKAGKVIVESDGTSVFSRVLQTQDFRGATATASKYGESGKKEKQRELLHASDDLKIELEKSPKEGKLIISPREGDYMRGEVGTIYSLNYEPEIEEGFVSKIIIKLLSHYPGGLGITKALLYNEPYSPRPIKQYELNRYNRFDYDYIQAIDDVFFYVNNSHPDLSTKHEKFGEIKFSECHFGIDVVDPPVTPIAGYSGDSAGAAIFICLMSAFFNLEDDDYKIAITGNLKSKYSDEVGLVGDIVGKIKRIYELGDGTKVDKLIIPDVMYMLREEIINREDISEIIKEIRAIENTYVRHAPPIVKFRSLKQAFRHLYDADLYGRIAARKLGCFKDALDSIDKP